MTQIVDVVAFLLFDREAGRVRPSALTGVGVVALAVASHFWLSGPWLEYAGFPAAAHPPGCVVSSPSPTTRCSQEASCP